MLLGKNKSCFSAGLNQGDGFICSEAQGCLIPPCPCPGTLLTAPLCREQGRKHQNSSPGLILEEKSHYQTHCHTTLLSTLPCAFQDRAIIPKVPARRAQPCSAPDVPPHPLSISTEGFRSLVAERELNPFPKDVVCIGHGLEWEPRSHNSQEQGTCTCEALG